MSGNKISEKQLTLPLDFRGRVFTLLLSGLLSPSLGLCSLRLLIANTPFLSCSKSYNQKRDYRSLRIKKSMGFSVVIAQAPRPALLPALSVA